MQVLTTALGAHGTGREQRPACKCSPRRWEPTDRTGAAPERPWIGDCDKACDLIRRTAPAGALRSWPRVCRLSSGRGHQGSSVYATRGPRAGRAGVRTGSSVRRGSVFRNSTATSPPWITIHDHVHTMRCARKFEGEFTRRTEGRNAPRRGEGGRRTANRRQIRAPLGVKCKV